MGNKNGSIIIIAGIENAFLTSKEIFRLRNILLLIYIYIGCCLFFLLFITLSIYKFFNKNETK